MILEIDNLHVNIHDKPIIKGLSLSMAPGTLHILMGPNGTGKSTLGLTLAGKPDYNITQGHIRMLGTDIADKSPEERAALGMFLAFQYPVAIPGISNAEFLRSLYSNKCKLEGLEPPDSFDFMKILTPKMQQIGLHKDLLARPLNEGFSGGEKKRNEMLQLALLDPKLAILDETDSGLDMDALKLLAQLITEQKRSDRAILVITHYQALVEMLVPDYIHVMMDGRIVLTEDASFIHTLSERGYEWLGTECSDV